MADIDLVIGAKNEARAVLQQVSADVAKTSQEIELSFKGILQVAGITAVIVATKELATSIADFASRSMTAFDQLNASGIRLHDTLDILGQSASSDQLKQAADSLERISNVDESSILDQMSKALRGGSSVAQIDDMAAAAIGLSKVFNTDLSSAMRMVQSATDGNFESFQGLIPNIEGLATAEEKLAAVSRLAAEGLSQKADVASSAAESGNRMAVAWKNVYETVGALLAPIRDVVFSGLTLLADTINSIILPAIAVLQEFTSDMAESMAANMHYFAESAVTAFTVVQTIFGNLGAVFDIAVNSVALSLESMRADFEHVLTVVIPAYGLWFYDNFLRILRDVAVAASHIVENLVLNIGNIITGKPLVGLLEGFQATVDELPKIAERGATDVEKVLRENIGKKMGGVMEDFEKNRAKNMEFLNKAFPGAIQQALPKIELEVNAAAAGGAAGANFGGPRGAGEQTLQAVESRLLTRGTASESVWVKIAENTAITAAQTVAMNNREASRESSSSSSDKLTVEVIE